MVTVSEALKIINEFQLKLTAYSLGIPYKVLMARMMIEAEKVEGYAFMRFYSQAGPWAGILQGE